MYPFVHPTPHGAADATVARQLAAIAKDRALFHARMAALLENLAGICRGASAPGEAAALMLSTGADIASVLRQLDDASTCCVLMIQTWQRELLLQAREDIRRSTARRPDTTSPPPADGPDTAPGVH